jgi:hypothetical protein
MQHIKIAEIEKRKKQKRLVVYFVVWHDNVGGGRLTYRMNALRFSFLESKYFSFFESMYRTCTFLLHSLRHRKENEL